ncbi:Dihydroorotate dehydrogenase B (NAD(+)), electron transfer subunit [bioreactor metagenome]|uniref:Dihydroorotate dehydrogenase B (NAD(+)), electron transfer subunit n=1 Tax=bioreactor metagenome TaxID=1076179 RepID=A0A645D6D0_9ZZZZ
MHQDLHRVNGDRSDRQPDGGQRRRSHRRQRRIVVSDDRHLSGQPDSAGVRPLDQSGGDGVVGGKNRGGSAGEHGFVTNKLESLLKAGNQYDVVIAIGPMIMMKFVSKTTEPYGIPTTVSMSPIMIDGTGMCGGCRLSVGGETKFACVDGPDFDGHKVDWDLAVKRSRMYSDFEKHKHEETCNLFSKEAE